MAVTHELGEAAPNVPPADHKGVENFQATEAGRELVSEWGANAPQKVATALARTRRMISTMSPDEANRAIAWFDNLTDFEAKAVIRQLAR